MTTSTTHDVHVPIAPEDLGRRFGAGSRNPSRVRLDAFARRASLSVPPGSRVLDAGAGEGAYRLHFGELAYESADFQQVDKAYGTIDHVCDLAAIPVEDCRFDLVLCTQVLEHLPEPGQVLDELRRVLKPGGQLWLTAPLFYPEHERPYDFYRYTSFGLRHRLAEAGFEIVSLEWLEGYFGTLAFQLSAAGSDLPVRPSAYGGGRLGAACAVAARALRPALRGLGAAAARLELRHRYVEGGHPKNFAVVARRPHEAPTDAAVSPRGD